ncbi:MAG: hypothetical protein V8S30_01970 [Merdibacter sp.]
MAMDLDSGELHLVSEWSDDEDNEQGCLLAGQLFSFGFSVLKCLCNHLK